MIRKLKQATLDHYELTCIYKSYIRPLLEYGAPLWNSGLTRAQLAHLEGNSETYKDEKESKCNLSSKLICPRCCLRARRVALLWTPSSRSDKVLVQFMETRRVEHTQGQAIQGFFGLGEYHVRNVGDFAEEVSQMIIAPGEELRSYDVSALFTSVPNDKALVVIKERLEEDVTLKERTSLQPCDIIRLVDFCLKCTYFSFRNQFYLQIHGAAMGSPVSPIVCNLYMEEFEKKAITSALHPPRWWRRYVDDTNAIMKKEHAAAFTTHINTVDRDIKWTTEGEVEIDDTNGGTLDKGTNVKRTLNFLDTWTVFNKDGSIKTKVFRKDTHTDQYLNFDSNHPLEHKRGVVRTLLNRANSIVSDDQDKTSKVKHIRKALRRNDYPDWFLNREVSETHSRGRSTATSLEGYVNRRDQLRKYPVGIPYIKGVSEQIRRVMQSYDVPVFFKPTNTLKTTSCMPEEPVK
ncbi:uncharacterized protein LOC117113123 [Anneissia japonica]|uniref:uncharacterized protein LOC117113123 n=1 Tax=Anneissia japonica TaxID=1529436 RepID=UPI001425ACB7|nr:uncharacterized protein LOC117113123 [Anneissia japonica]